MCTYKNFHLTSWSQICINVIIYFKMILIFAKRWLSDLYRDWVKCDRRVLKGYVSIDLFIVKILHWKINSFWSFFIVFFNSLVLSAFSISDFWNQTRREAKSPSRLTLGKLPKRWKARPRGFLDTQRKGSLSLIK